MKNFTNNFKQFTSRLSARWLIIALMMLVGTSSAWGWTVIYDNTDTQWDEVYLYVGNNDWSECNLKMTEYDKNLFVFKGSGWNDANEVVFADKALGGSATGSICTKLKNDNAINPKVTYSKNNDFSKIYKYKATGLTSSDANCSGEVRYYWPNNNSMVETTFSGNVIQLAGNFNDWGSSTDYCVSTNNATCSFEKELTAADNYQFKIVIDGVWYSGSAVTVDGDKIQFQNPWDANSSFKASKDGIYTFYVDKDKQVWITYRAACDKPDAPLITINPVSICSGESATITAGTVDGAISYSLYKGDNLSASQTNENGIFKVSEAASYKVTVTTCGESEKSSLVTLSEKPGPTASNYVIKDASKSKEYTGNEQTLTAEDITVNNNNAGAVVSVYFKQNGNTVNPINVGEYDVYVTTVATDDICAGDIKIGTFTITCPVVDKPAIDATNTIIQCGSNYTQKGQIAITKKVDGLTYTCNLNGTTDITIPDNGVISEITTPGTYIITATNGCGNNASTEVVISLTDNTVSISDITGSETICAGVTGQEYSIVAIDGVSSYAWSVTGEGLSTNGSTSNSVLISAEDKTSQVNGTLSLTVSKNGCETTIQQPKSITLIPLPTITTVDPTSGKTCSNTTIADLEAALTITKSDNSNTKWYFNKQAQEATNTLQKGEYTIKAISNTGECLSTQGIIYTVTEVETSPAVPFTDGKEGVICGSVTEFSLTELSGWDAEAGEEQGIKILWYTDSYTPTDDVQTDIKAGTYYARTLNGDCYSDYVALNIGEPQEPETITLTKDKEFTTPWIPIKVTVGATDGTYTLSYPDNLNTVKNIQITKDGNDYTYLIPRPKDWGTGNDDKQDNQPPSYKQVKYKVRATGNQGQCPDMGEITITLQDEDNDECTWK